MSGNVFRLFFLFIIFCLSCFTIVRELDATALALMRGETSSGSTSSLTAIGDTERVLGGIRTFEALVQVGKRIF